MNDKLATCEAFLRGKVQLSQQTGFSVADSDLHPSLFGFQRDMVRWAAYRGRALIAASFGLGKTRLQIELLRQAHRHTGRSTLVICPLGVKHQFVSEDGPAMGVQFVYVRNDEEALTAETPYLITNYERVRDGNIGAETKMAWICLLSIQSPGSRSRSERRCSPRKDKMQSTSIQHVSKGARARQSVEGYICGYKNSTTLYKHCTQSGIT